ncbi:MAG: ATP-binding protein [Dehalococcoidia bacterium]|nr:ATP-binding protein [Dehalococcoidia bacterium]
MEASFILLLLASIAASFFVVRRYQRLAQEAEDQSRLHQQEASAWQGAHRRAESLLEQVLTHAADAIIVTDRERRIIRYSPGAEELFGVPAGKALGRPFIEVTINSDLDQLLRSSLSSKGAEFSIVHMALNHKVLEASVMFVLEDTDTPYALIVMRDVTELRRLDSSRREFVANISHELRAPLAAIKAMVETLIDGALSDREASTRFLAQINAEVDNLTQLVRELLELSRIESGQTALRRSPAGVNELLKKAVSRLQAHADQQGLQVTVVEVPDNPVVILDEERVGQVVLNLLHNAIKFTPKGGQVRVLSSISIEDTVSVLSISVQDTGVGIPEDDLPRIFERFYKVDKARKRGEGTGLGLAVAKHMVQAQGGRIWAESREGQGSTFTFTIPIRQEPD